MDVLSHFRLRTKLTFLLGLSALAVVISIGAAASLMQRRMFNDRIDKLRAVVQSTIGIAQSLENRVVSHQFTREQALALLRDDVHAMRFDGGGGYVYAQTLDNMVVLHGANPAMEGKPAPATTVNENGRQVTELIRDALRNSDDGIVAYVFPKPGHTELEPKVSYVARFAPWDLVFVAGAYVDDLNVAFHASLLRLVLIGSAIIAVTLLATWLVNRDITASLGASEDRHGSVGERRPRNSIPGADRRDEVGGMAAPWWCSKTTWSRPNVCGPPRRRSRLRPRPNKRQRLHRMADGFESKVGHLVGMLSSASTELEATAQSMTSTANESNNRPPPSPRRRRRQAPACRPWPPPPRN